MAVKQRYDREDRSDPSAEELRRRCHSVLIGVPPEHQLHRRMEHLLCEITGCIQDGNPHAVALHLQIRFRGIIAEFNRTCQ